MSRTASRFKRNQPQLLLGDAVLLFGEGLLATGFLLHQRGDAATEMMHGVEQLVPEFAGAEAGDDGEIETDVEDGADGGGADDRLCSSAAAR